MEEPSEDNSSIRLKIPQPERSPLRIVSCENVGKSYGSVEVFNDLKFVVERENKIGLVGVNGAGKSTLLKMLAGVAADNTNTVADRVIVTDGSGNVNLPEISAQKVYLLKDGKELI